MNHFRSSGFWIINCNAAVRSYISKCATCRHLRLCEEPPFTYCSIDLFGPFIIKEGHKELKHYGVLSTCLSSRAIHIKTVTSLNTDSFILYLYIFVSQRGNIRLLRSDNGSNFVGASSEFKKAFAEMDQQSINDFMRDNGGEWMLWKQNLPSASNMSGVWEGKIRSAIGFNLMARDS